MRLTDEIQNEVNRVILGKEDVVRKILMAILAGGHILLDDVPGVGKTTMAMAFAKTLGLETKRVQFTSDTLPSDIIGFSVFNKQTESLKYQPGAVMTNLLLADEINRTSSKTQSALLEAMEERRVTVDGETHMLPDPFVVLATQNPVGSAGTQHLPESQLDRFLVKLSVGYPDAVSQMLLMKARHSEDPLDKCRAVTDKEKLRALCNEAMAAFVNDSVYEYIANIVTETRYNSEILLGVSPRGALAICRAAKANAFLAGRDYTTPDDVCAVLKPTCSHRIVLNSKAKLHERTPEQILDDITEKVKKPDIREFKTK